MIIIRANHDRPTNYLYDWSKEVIELAETKNMKVTKVENAEMTEKILRDRINIEKPEFIFFNGHGNATSMLNNKGEAFISTKSSDVFKDMIVFARACNCLVELGKNSVSKGCRAFVGYRKSFWVVHDHVRDCSPLKDRIAKPIMDSSNAVAKEIIKGKTVTQAIFKSNQLTADFMIELMHSSEPFAKATLYAMIVNDASLGFKGDPEARIG